MSVPEDKVPVLCPNCDKRLLVPAGTLGKQGRCPACKSVFTLEELFEAEPVATPVGPTSFNTGGNSWPAPATTKSPFGDDEDFNDYQLQAAYAAPQVHPQSMPSSLPSYQGSYQPPKPERTWDSSVLGGIAMMVIAVVWFFGALALGVIFIYPPILFIIGLIATIKGLFAGNLSGE